MTIRFDDGRAVIVTGAGGGLGRCHALDLAGHGARVVINDLVPVSMAAPPAIYLGVHRLVEGFPISWHILPKRQNHRCWKPYGLS